MKRQDSPVIGELHRVGFPMTGVCSVGERCRPLGDRHPAGDVQRRASTLAATIATLGLATRQVAPPGVVLGARDLAVDEAIDRFVAKNLLTPLKRQAAGHRFGRQPSLQELKNELLKLGLSQQPATAPTPSVRLLTGIAWRVTL